jgi:hypothetical protein
MNFNENKTSIVRLIRIFSLSLSLLSIRLSNLKESEAGFYTCEISNGFQTLTSTGFVRVKNSGTNKSCRLLTCLV